MEVLLFISFIFIPVVVIWFILWAIESRRNKRRNTIYNANGNRMNEGAQPVVQTTTCSNVIYTIPTNDPNRFSTNISTTLRHHYDLPPSYDQVVIQTVQTPSTPPTQPITAPTQLPERPPNYAEVPK